MTDPAPGPIDFGRASFDGGAGGALFCAFCNNAVDAEYYSMQGRTVCHRCKGRFGARGPGSAWKALAFGTIAGVAGAAAYRAITALTGYNLALVTIVVGVMVGKAVRIGAGNDRSALYRVTAIGLSWLAMGTVYVPLDEVGVIGLIVFSAIAPVLLLKDAQVLAVLIFAFGVWEAWKLSAPPESKIEGPFPAPALSRVSQRPLAGLSSSPPPG